MKQILKQTAVVIAFIYLCAAFVKLDLNPIPKIQETTRIGIMLIFVLCEMLIFWAYFEEKEQETKYKRIKSTNDVKTED